MEFKTGRVQEELEPSQSCCDGAAGSMDGYNLDGRGKAVPGAGKSLKRIEARGKSFRLDGNEK